MSRSRRRAAALALASIYALGGSARARLWVDATQKTGLGCPACLGQRFWTIAQMHGEPRGTLPEEPPAWSQLVHGERDSARFECNTCFGKGALRPRPIGSREHCEDQSSIGLVTW